MGFIFKVTLVFMRVTIEAGGLAPNIFDLEIDVISELYSAVAGTNGPIDTNNTAAADDDDTDTHGNGVVQTNRLYDSATAEVYKSLKNTRWPCT